MNSNVGPQWESVHVAHPNETRCVSLPPVAHVGAAIASPVGLAF